MRSTVSIRLFLSLFGLIFGFVVIVVGGAQWKIVNDLGDIKISTAVQAEKAAVLEERIRKIEQSIVPGFGNYWSGPEEERDNPTRSVSRDQRVGGTGG